MDMRKMCIALCLFINLVIVAKSQSTIQVDTFQLFFEIDVDQLSTQQSESLKQEFQSKDSILSVQILAYADYLHQKAYNQNLSERRANKTKQVLLSSFANPKLIQVDAKGRQEERSASEKLGNSHNRRCDIIIKSIAHSIELKADLKPSAIKSESFSVKENETALKLQELSVGEKFAIPNLLFYGSEHFVIDKSKYKMKEIYEALKANPNVNIEIHGHVCCVDEDSDAWDRLEEVARLSETRAEYIYDYLVEKGIAKNRLSHKGFGASQKIYPKERNSEEKLQNRRIEILITNK